VQEGRDCEAGSTLCIPLIPVQSSSKGSLKAHVLWPANCYPSPANSALSLSEFVGKKKVTVAAHSTPSILLRFRAAWLLSPHKTQDDIKGKEMQSFTQRI
jgi:hypothetical protein